jgi:hypothetical protein
MSTIIWEGPLKGLFASLLPSPGWAPFWSSLLEGAISAVSVWFIAQLGVTSTYTVQLICSLSIHLALFIFAVFYGYQDGWPQEAITECLGRTIIVFVFGMFSYTYFHEDDRARMFFPLEKRTMRTSLLTFIMMKRKLLRAKRILVNCWLECKKSNILSLKYLHFYMGLTRDCLILKSERLSAAYSVMCGPIQQYYIINCPPLIIWEI